MTETTDPRPWMESDVDRLARELHELGESQTTDLRKELAEYERAASDPREWPHHRAHSRKVADELREQAGCIGRLELAIRNGKIV